MIQATRTFEKFTSFIAQRGGELRFVFFVCLGTVCACAKGEDQEGTKLASVQLPDVSCTLDKMAYPTTASDFGDNHLLYGNRGFLAVYNNEKHLGRDIIYSEGTAMHPIGCGTLRFYGPASGYGTLVAVIEHKLSQPMKVVNGDGSQTQFTNFLSIYGHLRNTPQQSSGTKLPWSVGQEVHPQDIVGYTQADALNGDGPEHLHLGIRLQTVKDAKVVDPSAWFRGNDTPGDGQYKKYYTDPKTFLPALNNSLQTIQDAGKDGDGSCQGCPVKDADTDTSSDTGTGGHDAGHDSASGGFGGMLIDSGTEAGHQGGAGGMGGQAGNQAQAGSGGSSPEDGCGSFNCGTTDPCTAYGSMHCGCLLWNAPKISATLKFAVDGNNNHASAFGSIVPGTAAADGQVTEDEFCTLATFFPSCSVPIGAGTVECSLSLPVGNFALYWNVLKNTMDSHMQYACTNQNNPTMEKFGPGEYALLDGHVQSNVVAQTNAGASNGSNCFSRSGQDY